MSDAVTPQDFPEIRWRGHWIWVPEEPVVPNFALVPTANPDPKEAHGLFRKTIRLDSVPERVPARVTADSRYVLFANGQEVFRGPIRSQPRRLHYDLFDLAPYLRSGVNTLAVHVKYYGTATSFWMPAVPNMTLGRTGLLVFEADLGAAGWVASDASWKARKAGAWSDEWRGDVTGPVSGGVPMETFDARVFPFGWQEAWFDDTGWGAAQVVPATHIGGFARTQPPTDPYGPLYPRPIAKLGGEIRGPSGVRVETLRGEINAAIASPVKRIEATLELPRLTSAVAERLPVTVDVRADSVARLILDMGRIVSGFVQFELSAAPGTVVDLWYVEEPIRGPAGALGQHAGTRYVARGENDRFEVFDSNGFRYAYALAHGATPRRLSRRNLLPAAPPA